MSEALFGQEAVRGPSAPQYIPAAPFAATPTTSTDTTTPTVEGRPVRAYHGIVTGETILGANIFRDVFAGIRDIVGGRSAANEPAHAGWEDAALLDRVEFDVARAQAAVIPAVLDATTQLFEVGGASITSEALRLDRHWRNARVLASHNPLIYRARLLGDRAVNGTPLGRHYRLGG